MCRTADRNAEWSIMTSLNRGSGNPIYPRGLLDWLRMLPGVTRVTQQVQEARLPLALVYGANDTEEVDLIEYT